MPNCKNCTVFFEGEPQDSPICTMCVREEQDWRDWEEEDVAQGEDDY